MRAIIVTGILTGYCLASALGSAATPGVELSVVVTTRAVADEAVPEIVRHALDNLLPSGTARVSYVTDGFSVRAAHYEGMFGIPPGAIRLARREDKSLYVVNPEQKTYYIARTDPWGKGTEAPVVSIDKSTLSKQLLGHKATKVTLNYSQRVQLRGGQGGQGLQEVKVRVENWCTAEVRVPASLPAMMDVAGRIAGLANMDYAAACPLALESAVRLSVLQGVEVLTTVEQIKRVPDLGAAIFDIPAGFQDVTKHEGSTK
jgi:hypothetical protein